MAKLPSFIINLNNSVFFWSITAGRYWRNSALIVFFYHDIVTWYCFSVFLVDNGRTVLTKFCFDCIFYLFILFVGVQASRNSVTTRRCQATCSLMLRNNGSAPSILVIHVVCFYGMLCKLLVVISTVVLVWSAYFSKFEHLGKMFSQSTILHCACTSYW